MRVSKFLSYLLRHNPHKYSLKLDEKGFADLEKVVKIVRKQFPNLKISEGFLTDLIKNSDKKRFEISEGKIRAYYGHSIDKKIRMSPLSNPPETLYHGTTNKAFKRIQKEGLKSKGRQYVHLSKDITTAKQVGKRRTSDPVILVIEVEKAINDGIVFYKSGDMYLSEHIPENYISKID